MIAYVLLLLALSSYPPSTSLIDGTWYLVDHPGTIKQLSVAVTNGGALSYCSLGGVAIDGTYSPTQNKFTFITIDVYYDYIEYTKLYVGYYFTNNGTPMLAGYSQEYTPYKDHIKRGWYAVKNVINTSPRTPTSFVNGIWNSIVANHRPSTFSATFNSDGTLTGVFQGYQIAGGFWDMRTQTVVFSINFNGPTDPSSYQLYFGWMNEVYMLTSTNSIASSYQVINGYAILFSGIATSEAYEFGWRADIRVAV